MKYTKVKILWGPTDEPKDLERQINEFLDKDEVIDLVDVKFTINPSSNGSTYEAMIIYREWAIG